MFDVAELVQPGALKCY